MCNEKIYILVPILTSTKLATCGRSISCRSHIKVSSLGHHISFLRTHTLSHTFLTTLISVFYNSCTYVKTTSMIIDQVGSRQVPGLVGCPCKLDSQQVYVVHNLHIIKWAVSWAPPGPTAHRKDRALLVVRVRRAMQSGSGGGLEGGEGRVEDVELLRGGEEPLDVVDEPDRGDLLHHRPLLFKTRYSLITQTPSHVRVYQIFWVIRNIGCT